MTRYILLCDYIFGVCEIQTLVIITFLWDIFGTNAHRMGVERIYNIKLPNVLCRNVFRWTINDPSELLEIMRSLYQEILNNPMAPSESNMNKVKKPSAVHQETTNYPRAFCWKDKYKDSTLTYKALFLASHSFMSWPGPYTFAELYSFSNNSRKLPTSFVWNSS